LSVSEKLLDYYETKELLGRLKVRELKKLAEQNSIALEKEDISSKVKPAKTKEEMIDVLVNSNFKEPSLVELLGLSRLTKEEILNHMNTRQLKRLAKESGVLLEKTTFFGTKKVSKKEDIVHVLEVLSTSKIRDYAERTFLIRKPAKKEGRKRRGVKTTAKKQSRTSTRKPAGKGHKRMRGVKLTNKHKTNRGIRIIEEVIKERVTKREIIRRRVTLGISDYEVLKALKSAPFVGPPDEIGYEAQLSRWLSVRGYPFERERPRKDARFDLVLGENEIAVELKTVRNAIVLERLLGQIYRYKDQFRKIYLVLIDELGDPSMMKREVERIEKMDPEKIKVIVKKTKRK
jgi:hypothetical protein